MAPLDFKKATGIRLSHFSSYADKNVITSDRSVSYDYKADNVTRILQKSCPQGSILSSFLWPVNVDDLLRSELPTGCTIQV